MKNYPITTSKTIINTKPIAKPIVERLECSPDDASGISSSTTTPTASNAVLQECWHRAWCQEAVSKDL